MYNFENGLRKEDRADGEWHEFGGLSCGLEKI